MQKRKITEDIANRFHLGHTENSVVFPLYDVSGECVGYSERNIFSVAYNEVKDEYNYSNGYYYNYYD